MYKNLIEEKLKSPSKNEINYITEVSVESQTEAAVSQLNSKTKVLYRYISKNCHEVHNGMEEGCSFPELNTLFIEATIIYSEPVSTISDSFLHYISMSFLLSKVVTLRKNTKLEITESHRLISEILGTNFVLSKENINLIRRGLAARMSEYRLKCFTDYKAKFVTNDNLTEIHRHFLNKQLNFIDQQIIKIQNDIKDVLNMKSSLTKFRINKN
jgi:uncharacterized phage infection (PIP) family protein YhgE